MSTAERTDDVLVGRSDVLDHLTELRASAGSGGLAVLVSEGEAGIGKTALAEMEQRNAAEQGACDRMGPNP
jgi:predicted ATPase